jgi:hypothetical protein
MKLKFTSLSLSGDDGWVPRAAKRRLIRLLRNSL